MQSVRRQAQSFGDVEQALIARPEGGTYRQPDGCEQVRIDIADPQAEEPMPADEMQHFRIAGHAGLRQIPQGGQNKVALPQVTEGKFANHERMGENVATVEQARKRLVARAQMVDPNRRVD